MPPEQFAGDDHDILIQLLNQNRSMMDDLKELIEDHDKLRESVWGNGKPGLLGRLDKLEANFSILTKAMWALSIPITLGILGFLWGVLSGQIQIITH